MNSKQRRITRRKCLYLAHSRAEIKVIRGRKRGATGICLDWEGRNVVTVALRKSRYQYGIALHNLRELK